MKLTSNIPDIIASLQKAASQSATLDVSSALAFGMNITLQSVKFRIFNKGHDIANDSIGGYVGSHKTKANTNTQKILSALDTDNKRKTAKKNLKEAADTEVTEYEKKRLAEGRQIAYKDLEFTGDLRNGFVIVVQSNTKVVAAIPNPKLFLIAQGQTEQISKILKKDVVIFGLSNDERKILNDNTNSALKQLYARLFDFK